MDSSPLFLTGNIDTVYAAAMLDLEKDGVTVIEIPPGAGPGTVSDAFFRFVVDWTLDWFLGEAVSSSARRIIRKFIFLKTLGHYSLIASWKNFSIGMLMFSNIKRSVSTILPLLWGMGFAYDFSKVVDIEFFELAVIFVL